METERFCPNCRKPLPPDVPLGLCPECLIKSGFPTGTEPGEGGIGRFVPPPVEEIAKLFPQFEILSFIGKGGMGAVYKARQPALDRFVALKVLPPTVANDPGFAERFNREARALARLSHPNIVVVYDFGTTGALNYLVMEFVDGTNLREVERAGRLSSEQALAIVPQICEALQFAHNEGIVHRDIKPENLLIDKKGRVKIADFGIAKIVDVAAGKVSLTGAKDVVGTPHYMAPEQIEKPQTVDHRADIYSLGVVFYEMLTGELPLGKFAPPSKKVQVDVRLDEVVLHTLEKEPERRYQQASQVKTDVETIAGTAAPPVMGAAAIRGAAPPFFPAQPTEPVSDKIILPAFLLAFFFGIFGAHRFYAGKIGTGILQLFTFGGLGIWTTIDWILILCKVFTDKQGRRITNWWHPTVGAPKPPPPHKPPIPPIVAGAPSGGNHAMIVAPAVALMAAGCLKLFFALMALLFDQFGWRVGPLNSAFGHIGFPVWGFYASFTTVVFSVIPALVIIYGAVEMMRIRCYGWAVAAAIVAIAFCNIIGFPAGIWAMIVLLQQGVRERFARQEMTTTAETWPWILGGVAAVCLLFVLMMSLLAFLFEGHHAIPFASQATVHVARAPQPPSQPVPPTAPTPPTLPTMPEALNLPAQNLFTNFAGLPFQNTGMEEGTDTPTAWKMGPQVAGVEQIWDHAAAHSGMASLCLKKTEQHYWPVADWSQEISVTPVKQPQQLRVRCWIKAEDVSKAIVDVTYRYRNKRDEHAWAIHIGQSDSPANFDWKLCEGTVEVPANVSKIGIAFEIYGPGTVWFDDVDVAWQTTTVANAAPPVVLNGTGSLNLPDQTNAVGSSATFAVVANGTPPLAYQWYFGGTNLSQGIAIAHLTNQTIDVGGATDFSQSFTVEPGGS
jgi:TM2 domain-containing membrane protein YozV/predicted Ser/Thr protein kinase